MLPFFVILVLLWFALLGFFAYVSDQRHSRKAIALWIADTPFIFAPIIPSLVWLWLPPLMALWLMGGYVILAGSAFFAVTVKT